MNKRISSVLISVFYKDGIEKLLPVFKELQITVYSTGGTQKFIEGLGYTVTSVEEITGYPSILGGRVKTLHPKVFGGILGKRDDEAHVKEMDKFGIPQIDLVIVDLYPFEETVSSPGATDNDIIEKIDIGGPSMIRAAAKNHKDVLIIASKEEYECLANMLMDQKGETTLLQRREFAKKAFGITANYEKHISAYFIDHFMESL